LIGSPAKFPVPRQQTSFYDFVSELMQHPRAVIVLLLKKPPRSRFSARRVSRRCFSRVTVGRGAGSTKVRRVRPRPRLRTLRRVRVLVIFWPGVFVLEEGG
jgi:hypothetical protein